VLRSFVFFTLGDSDERFLCRTSPDFRGKMDEDIWISFKEKKIHVFDYQSEEELV